MAHDESTGALPPKAQEIAERIGETRKRLLLAQQELEVIEQKIAAAGAGETKAVGDTAVIKMSALYRDKLRGERQRKMEKISLLQTEIDRLQEEFDWETRAT